MTDNAESVCAVIPARLESTRLPGKVLLDIHGKPLIWYVWNQVKKARGLDQVIVATDSIRVKQAVESWGGEALLTSPDCQSGTERIASVLHLIQAEMILNVQGDEPMVDPGMLEDLISAWREIHPDLVTPVYPILSEEDLSNPNIVKVARGKDGRAVYFSRSPIPYLRDVPRPDWVGQKSHWGHIGVYGYSRRVLEAYPFLPASLLESQEHLEQLRFLEAGYQIITIETDYHSIAVDTPDDLDLVRQRIGRDYEPY